MSLAPTPRQQLNTIADCLLDENPPMTDYRQALEHFASLCANITGINANPSFDAWAQDNFLPQGLAINPEAAAQCVKDYRRSLMFIRAFHAAIVDLQQQLPQQNLIIYYAGCGPYATLLLALLTRLQPTQLSFHLIDIHTASLDSVATLIEALEFTDFNINLIEADASRYQCPSPPHLIVTETMQKALEQEPQFAITLNLAPQLHRQGVFIPESININFALVDLEAEQQSLKIGQSSVFDPANKQRLSEHLMMRLNQQSAAKYKAQLQHQAACTAALLPIKNLQITNPNTQYQAAILTELQLYGDYQLKDYDADISLPLIINDLPQDPAKAETNYQLSYRLGTYPKFEFTRILSTKINEREK